MTNRVRVVAWELIFKLPKNWVSYLFQQPWFVRMIFPGGETAANGLDKKLRQYLGNIMGGFFIEIGGNDGISQSNSKYLEMFQDWNGLLVEPEPENFRRMFLTRNFSTHKVRAACVDFEYRQTEVELSSGDLMSVALDLPTDLANRQSHIALARNFQKRRIKSPTFTAPARTLDSLLDEVAAPKTIDFFSLDVEGAEMSVLQGLDFDRWNISFLLIESRSPKELETFLNAKGFTLVGNLTTHDYFFRKNST